MSKSTVGAFERREETARLTTMNNRALVEAFERAGLEFIPENGGGAGIRFRERKSTKPDEGLRLDQLTSENDGGAQG